MCLAGTEAALSLSSPTITGSAPDHGRVLARFHVLLDVSPRHGRATVGRGRGTPERGRRAGARGPRRTYHRGAQRRVTRTIAAPGRPFRKQGQRFRYRNPPCPLTSSRRVSFFPAFPACPDASYAREVHTVHVSCAATSAGTSSARPRDSPSPPVRADEFNCAKRFRCAPLDGDVHSMQ